MRVAEKKLCIAIIVNGISMRRKEFYQKFLPTLQHHHNIDVFETKSKNDAILLSSKAVETYKYDVILAAGGDGTLNQVVNGVIKGRERQGHLPVIGVIPMGSGNDFAKTAGLKAKPEQLLLLLRKFKSRKIDLGKITYTDTYNKIRDRYFINVADIGMGPEVVKKVSASAQTFGSAVAYFKSIVSTFYDYKPVLVDVKSSDWTWSGKLRSLAVANGRYYGHGLCVAPEAELSDHMFNVFICGNVSILDFIRHSVKLKKGVRVTMPEISYQETKSIELTSHQSCMIEGDGEVLGGLPAKVQMTETKVEFLM